MNDFSCSLFFFFGSIYKFPAFFNFSSENSNCIWILLGEFDCSLNFCSILYNSIIQLFASSNKSFFTFIWCFQSSMKFLIFFSELLHWLILNKFFKYILEISFQCFILGWVYSHLNEIIVHLTSRVRCVSHFKFNSN